MVSNRMEDGCSFTQADVGGKHFHIFESSQLEDSYAGGLTVPKLDKCWSLTYLFPPYLSLLPQASSKDMLSDTSRLF